LTGSSNAVHSDAMDSPRLRFPPTPSAAPGEDRFRHLCIDAAGDVGRPSSASEASDIAPLAHRLVRVLDDSGRAVGPWVPAALDRAGLVLGLRDMCLVRAFDAAMLRAHRQGKTSFYMQSLGEEAIACAHRRALAPGDMTFPTYRQQGLLIAADYPVVDMMNQVFSNSRDPVRGRQLPVFYTSKDKGFFSISVNLGTQYVQAVGWAMASAIGNDERIASAWIGEGATAEPDFHAALLFAATYQAPVILNIVNNQWAISTHQVTALGASATFAQRGAGFGIPAMRVDGNDYLAVYAATEWAADRARAGHGPTVIEWLTYRVGAHSTSDNPDAYRPAGEARAWPLGDPIARLAEHLRVAHGWSDDEQADLDRDIGRVVAEALAAAEACGTVKDGPTPEPSTMFDDVYAVPPRRLLDQRRQATV
jgi:2-oxoisovalerate dehydrogenase E1 component alpha subunit